MVAYTRLKLERLLKVEFIRFCIVGGSGFIINFIILTILHRILSVEIFIAQLIGAEIALFSNFVLHDRWTYKSHHVTKTKHNLIIQFHATSWPAILGSALMVSAAEKFLHFSNLFALILSSVIVLLWNFVWSKFIIWRDVSSKEVEEEVR